MNSFTIGKHTIGPKHPPFIVAEMSGNHNQSLERALKIIDAAAHSGAHAIKLQTYTPETMTLNVQSADFRINSKGSLWDGRYLFDLYKDAYTPWEWHKPIWDHCAKLGIICFSTPFDESAVDFLESLNTPFYKVASFENTDLPLIRYMASKKKPMIISTGMATEQEIQEAVDCAKNAGCPNIVLLKCTSTYPASPENTNILTIPYMQKKFQTLVGLSDHTMGIGVSIASISLGAVFIEKHFTLSREDGGVDSSFSMEPEEFHSLVIECERAWKSLGTPTYGATHAEKPNLQFRRSLYVAKDMKAGDLFTKENVRIIRPGFGIEPKHFEQVLGKKANQDLKIGTALKWDLILS